MADGTDVCNFIANVVNSIVQPLVGTSYPIIEPVDAEAIGSEQVVPEITVMLSRPMQKDLEGRLAKGLGSISVELDDKDAVAEQYANEWRRQDRLSVDPITLTVTPSTLGPTTSFAFGGTVTQGNIVGVQCGAIGATYEVRGTDDIPTIASNLAAACVSAGIDASASSNVLTVDALAGPPTVKIGAQSTWLVGTSRAARSFLMELWMPDPYIRQFLLKAIEPALTPGMKLEMPDGSQATINSKNGPVGFSTMTDDGAARDNLFVSVTNWFIEWVVTKIDRKAPIVAATLTLNATAVNPRTPIPANLL